MNVPSFQFLLFAAVCAILFNLSRSRVWRAAVLLATNLLFFASEAHGVLSVLPFAAFLAMGFAFTSRRGPGRFALPVLVCATVLVFAWLKKYAFFPYSSFLPFPYMVIGLSYVFFRVLHLVIDVRSGALPERPGPIRYINYTLNFTALISGPIQRYEDYRAQEDAQERIDLVDFGLVLERIAIGFFKVFVLSSLLHQWQTQAISTLAASSDLPTRFVNGMIVTAAYPLFLYCNFSGYTDVVIAVGRLFGFRLPENFNHPFWSDNFINFWGRWHITLSSWLKTYVYNTLLLRLMSAFPSRTVEPFLGVIAFFVAFFLVGIWHGQTTEFVMFGVLQGGGVAANKLYQIEMTKRLGRKPYKALGANRLYQACCRGLTFTWFAFTLYWFWADWPQIGAIFGKIGPAAFIAVLLGIFVLATIVIEVAHALILAALRVQIGGRSLLVSRYVRTSYATVLLALTVGLILLSNSPAPDIVYKNF